jgi:valyl-tRNA synthetase
MIMAGYEFAGDKPFSRVHLHGIVRDEIGRKMSKSLGNSPDPLELIEKYGADALRFTMLMLTPQGTDVLFGEKKIETGRNFANKLWNAARFALMNIGDQPLPAGMEGRALSDRWLRSRLGQVTREAARQIDEFRFNDVSHVLYDFVWHEYCDWYLEMAKVRIGSGGDDAGEARRGILFGLTTVCSLLHPLMPFITEEIWHHLPGTDGDLINTPWPDPELMPEDAEAEEAMRLLMETVVTIRNLRSEMNVPPAREAAVSIRTGAAAQVLYADAGALLRSLARISDLHLGPDLPKPRRAASGVVGSSEVFLHLEGLIDLDLERARLTRELDRTQRLLLSVKKKLENPEFLDKARDEVVEKEREKLVQLEQTLAKLQRALHAVEE